MTTPAEAWRSRIVDRGDVAPTELTANPRNWRRHPKAQKEALAGVLSSVGWVQDVIVNKRTGLIVDGHARVELAIERHEATVPVVYVDLEPEEEALVLATFDPLSAMALTDKAKQDELFASLSGAERLVEVLGHFRRLPSAGNTDPDAIPEPPKTPTSRPGDLFVLGDHRLLCGDATRDEDAIRLMEGIEAALMWTDPPYGVEYVGKTRDALKIENDGAASLPDLLADSFRVAIAALERGAPVYVAHPAGAQHIVFWDAARDAGLQIHEEIVWVKDTMVLGHMDYHSRHESLLYGWTPGPGRSGRGRHEGSRWYGDHAQTSVFEIPRPKASPDHPTAKPVELVERCLQNSSRPGDVVYEPFSGSGTTIMACERLGRRCFALEIDPRYVDVAVARWEAFTGKTAERISVSETAE